MAKKKQDEPKRRGPKKKQLDRGIVERSFENMNTLADVARLMGVCRTTLNNWIVENTEFDTPIEFKEACQAPTRDALKSVALGSALEGNEKMLLFLLKNYCGMADKVEQNTNATFTVNLDGNLANNVS